MSAIKIIPYNNNYKTAVPAMIVDVYENEMGFTGIVREDIRTISESYNPKNKSNFWLAIDGDALVGTVGVFNKGNGVAYLKRLIVQKGYRKKGIGEQLLKTALQFARDQGYNVLYAGTVEENTNAIAFYEHLGFTRSAVVPEDITASQDSVCLEYHLSINT